MKKDFSIVFWNSRMEEWTGIDRDEITGADLRVKFPHLNENKYVGRFADVFNGGPPTIFSSQLHRHIIPVQLLGGELMIQHTTVSAIPSKDSPETDVIEYYAIFSIQDMTKSTRRISEYRKIELELLDAHNNMEIKVQERTKELSNLTKHLQDVREKERLLISRNIHDDLGQTLSAIKLDLTWVKKRLPSREEELIDKLEETSNLVIGATETVQRIASDLRPAMLDDLGLVSSVEWQAKDFEKRTGIKHILSVCCEPYDLSEKLSVELFRIFQEGLTNVMRHSEATMLEIDMREEKGILFMQIKDNGKGITSEQINGPGSLGLIGMRERVASWGGKLELKGMAGKGTTITVTIPLNLS